ncbi:MAG: hypothetical protein IBX58_18805 [Roseovarius sp.]|nr:hypothetical protein [Roseovarius sp.]
MPFTHEEFFEVFAVYNAAIWPMPILAYLLGAAAVGLTFWSSRMATGLISVILALMWLVNGGAYHWSFFAEVNPVARGFGILFVVQALLLVGAPFVWKSFRIVARHDARTVAGFGLAAFAALLYPALGWLAGHVYPATPMFGVAPCPTTIFTIGLLLLGTWRVARWLLIIPALWALIGGSAAVLLNVPQDFGLIAALLVAVGFAVAVARGAELACHETSET